MRIFKNKMFFKWAKSEGLKNSTLIKAAKEINHRTIFIYGFPKNQRDNISEQEEKALKKLAQNLLNVPENELKEMIANGDLYEVTS
jgi:hypothetical protein